MNSLDTKLGLICKNYDPANVTSESLARYEKIIQEVDAYIHSNQINLMELEQLLQKYADSLKKV